MPLIKKLNIENIHSMNLFEKVIRIKVRYCFEYNSSIIFIVNPINVARAIGEDGENVKKLSNIIKKKVKIIALPTRANMGNFIKSIIYPVRFRKLSVKNNEIIISAGPQAKALLIGRAGIRLEELQNILQRHFAIKKIKIV